MPGRRFTDEQRDEMAERREAGQTFMEIARAFGCSASNVSWICLTLGADKPGAKPVPSNALGPMVTHRNGFAVRRYSPDEDARLLVSKPRGRATPRSARPWAADPTRSAAA